ncbi:MAG: ATPase [Pseudomonadota bacterium]
MRLTVPEYNQWPNKAITLLGMSGVGKTTIARKVSSDHWFHYSGDYRIGTKYLSEPIIDDIKKQAMQVDCLRRLLRSDSIYIASNITTENLAPLSNFVGKIGREDKGGLSLDEFKKRQRMHLEAEISAMRDIVPFIEKAHDIYQYPHFINDAGGSVCELDHPPTIALLAQHTLMIYIEADADREQDMIQSQLDNPKPLYYHATFFDQQLAIYLSENSLDSASAIEPDDFVRWIFPRLIAARKPRYEAIVQQYGYTVTAKDVGTVRDEQDFHTLITQALGSQQ